MHMGIIVIMIVFLFAGVVGIVALGLEHVQKMEKIKRGPGGSGDSRVMEAVEELRREVAELRDTSTRYDVSFDSALQRLEGRIGGLERRVGPADGARESIEARRS